MRDIDLNTGAHTMPPDGSIDAGLAILEMVTPRGAWWTQEEIAIACGCSRGYIWLVEKNGNGKTQESVPTSSRTRENMRTKGAQTK